MMSNKSAASAFKGSLGFGYKSNLGKNPSKIFFNSKVGIQVWFITSKQIVLDLSSTFGSYILFTKPILEDLYG